MTVTVLFFFIVFFCVSIYCQQNQKHDKQHQHIIPVAYRPVTQVHPHTQQNVQVIKPGPYHPPHQQQTQTHKMPEVNSQDLNKPIG